MYEQLPSTVFLLFFASDDTLQPRRWELHQFDDVRLKRRPLGTSLTAPHSWVRGDRNDFDVWANKYGCAGWSYEEVLPYFKRIETFEKVESSSV